MPYVYKHRRPPEPWHEFRTRAKRSALLPYFAVEFVCDWLAYFLSQWSFLEVLEYAGSLSILFAVIFYFAESGERTQARHYQAWQVINTAQGKGGSGGRTDALAQLNEDHVALVAVDVSKAFLQGVKLEKANLLRADFSDADLRDAKLANANLELSDFTSANLRSADLDDTNLRGANLKKADLNAASMVGVDIAGANFDEADLSDADLAGLMNWQTKTSWDHANIAGIRNAPAGFVEWAMKHGAVMTVADDPAAASTQPSAATRP